MVYLVIAYLLVLLVTREMYHLDSRPLSGIGLLQRTNWVSRSYGFSMDPCFTHPPDGFVITTHSHSNNSSLILYCISTLPNIHWKIFPNVRISLQVILFSSCIAFHLPWLLYSLHVNYDLLVIFIQPKRLV